MNDFPELTDQLGIYNAPPSQFDTIQFDDNEGTRPQTNSHAPSIAWPEFIDAQKAVYRCLQSHARSPGWTDKEAKTFYEFCVGDELVDRTLQIELPDPNVLNSSLVEQLQKDVLAERPLWRIMIMAESKDTVVVIYPAGVWFEGASASKNWRPGLVALSKRLIILTDQRKGPERRQLAYLANRVPKELPRLQHEPYCLVGLFDNYCGKADSWSLWILWPTEEEWFEISVAEPDSVASSISFAVRPDGSFGREYDSDNPVFWLTKWVLPAGYNGKLTIEKIRVKQVVERRWTVDLDLNTIVKDADLKAREIATSSLKPK